MSVFPPTVPEATHLRLHKEQIYEQYACHIDNQVQRVELPSSVRDAHWCSICVDEAHDVEPQARHGKTFGSCVLGENLGWIERLARRPDKGNCEQEHENKADA